MSLNVKPPALVMLAGVLWLSAADLALAETPSSKREQFIALLANRQRKDTANRLEQQFTQLNVQSQILLQQQNLVTAKLTNPPPPPILVRLNRLDHQLQQQSARILAHLQKINGAINANSTNATALGRLRGELTRQESVIGQRILTVQRLERSAATPFAPGGL